jgi:hypothetical protein
MFIKLAILISIFVPFFWHPFAINLHPDTADQLLMTLRLADGHFSTSFSKESLLVNPIFQLLRNSNGINRQIFLLPIFYVMDLFRIPLHESSVLAVFVIAQILFLLLVYFFIKPYIGEKKAMWFICIIAVIPYELMQMKAGWWQLFSAPFFFLGLYILHKFLVEEKNNWYKYFAIVTSLYILSTPAFIFGVFFLRAAFSFFLFT